MLDPTKDRPSGCKIKITSFECEKLLLVPEDKSKRDAPPPLPLAEIPLVLADRRDCYLQLQQCQLHWQQRYQLH
jgi:hypothetical protein